MFWKTKLLILCETSYLSKKNYGLVYTLIKKKIFFLSNDDWLSSPSPGSVPSSAPPLSPSPGSQSHNYNTMSNGYSSPMSNGSYDPYSPNGKIGECNVLYVKQ